MGDTQISSVIESFGSHVEGQEAIATGELSHAEGDARAYGDYSHAEASAVAEGDFSHAEATSSAQGDYSHSEGQAQANGDYSHAEGYSTAYQDFMHSEGLNMRQFNRVVCGATTVGSSSSAFNNGSVDHVITFPNYGRTVLVTARVIARRQDTAGTVSAWSARCIIDGNGDNAYRIVGDPAFTMIAQDAGASSWAVSDIEVDGSDDLSFNVSVTGETGKTVAWEATFEFDEVRIF